MTIDDSCSRRVLLGTIACPKSCTSTLERLGNPLQDEKRE